MDVPGLRHRIRSAVVRRRRLWAVLCIALVGLVGVRATWTGASAATLEEALAIVAARSGVRVDPSTVLWLDEDDGPLTMRGALFLGAAEGELADLWYADVRAGGDGTALDVAWLTNLTRTGSAEEQQMVRLGQHVALVTRVGDHFDALVVIDTAGEPAELTSEWSTVQRWQNAVTNVQETGRSAGFGVRRYQLVDRPSTLRLSAADGRFVADLGEGRIEIDTVRVPAVVGADRVELQPQTKGIPGTIAWVVDTVRNVSWIGPEPIEWLEHRVFALKDQAQQGWHGIAGEPDTAAQVAEDLAMPEAVDEERMALLTATDPELGWPPPAVTPILPAPVEGEGAWIPVVDDPYVNAYPGAPPGFYQTFLRSDPARAYTRVYITIWDPRQVQLRMVAGTREPESATGQRGTGMVPRDESTLRRLVGAFNGGFQALHGEFGMMADGRVYLPPKPWAATVAVFDDGRVGMGSWPAPDWRGGFDENLATRQIPEGMVEYRQNLTSVVEDGRWNPWERWYWGAVPRGAAEQTLTTRSGLCLTQEGFMAYFWGQGMGPEALGAAMNAARCSRGLHLDMNSAHCGLEFFRPIAPGEAVAPLPRPPRAEAEFEGALPDAPEGWRLRARRGVRSMEMPFPRYSASDGRDFFYLVLRPVLPGPAVAVPRGAEGEGVFRTEGLPHAGWPHAFARAFLGRAPTARTWLVRIDPRRAIAAPLAVEAHRRPLAYLTEGARLTERADHGLVARRTTVGWELRVGRPGEGDRVVVAGPPLSSSPTAEAAMGVDRDGYLVYAERAGDPTPLLERLRAAGVADAVALPSDARLAFAAGEAHAGPDGVTRRTVTPASSLAFLAEERPVAEVLFPDNTPLPYRSWSFLQDQRVRYFPQSPPRFVRSGQR
jgi:hypothetical protein